MKMSIFQLSAHLTKKKWAPAYLVSGDDYLQKQEAKQSIRHALQQDGFLERQRYYPDQDFDWQGCYTAWQSNSLFQEKRIIELAFPDTTPNKEGAKLLADYASHPLDTQVLLLDIGKVNDTIAKSSWYKALEKVGIVVTIWPITRDKLPAWLQTRAAQLRLRLQPDACQLLADWVEGNSEAANAALIKLTLFNPDTPIDSRLLQSLLQDESRFTLFDFIEALVAGNMKRAFQILSSLQAEGTEPAVILWGITREIRLLIQMHQALKAGKSYDELWQNYRIFGSRQQAIRHYFKKDVAAHTVDALQAASNLDQIIKGRLTGNIWDALQLFCLRWAG